MKSLRNKLGLFIIALMLFTCIIITGSILLVFYQNMSSQLQEDVNALSASYSKAVENQIRVFRNEIQLAASINGITSLEGQQKDELLKSLADKTGFEYLAVADATGQTSRNSDISKREYFQKALVGETYMSSPLVNMVDGQVTIMMATPIDNGSGFRGVLYGGILYDTFSQNISNIKIGEGGYAFIIDKVGVVAAHPNVELVKGMVNYIEETKSDSAYQSVADVISRMSRGESGVDYADYNGERRLYGFTPINGPEQWAISVSVPVSQIMANIYKVMFIGLAIGLVLMTIGIFFALAFAKNITKPIVAATERIERLAVGNLSEQVVVSKGRDELARMTGALHSTVLGLNSYIADISGVLTALSNSDLTAESEVDYQGEFSPIKESLIRISDSLNKTVSIIITSTEQVNTGAQQIAAGAQNLASGSSQQAASIEELSSSIERISEQDAKNVEYVRHAVSYMKETTSVVRDCTHQMEVLSRAMERISASSGEISSITKVIEEIAFQTNILALNAAVEAARAGAAGKGFAVVADEVRNLAAKSAQAAKQTAELLEGSSEAVIQGSQVASKTQELLLDMAQKTDQVTESISRVDTASAQQAEAISQVAEGIAQVSAVVQVNASTAEQSSAASQQLSSLSSLLREEVARFKLK